MSETAIDSLDTAALGLRKAMEGSDPDTIDKAMSAFAAALETLRGVGAWHADPALKERLRLILTRLESDKRLALLLGDLVRQRLASLSGTMPDSTGSMTYGRQG